MVGAIAKIVGGQPFSQVIQIITLTMITYGGNHCILLYNVFFQILFRTFTVYTLFYGVQEVILQSMYINTVKLGYKNLGCNKLPVITNKISHFSSPKPNIYYINELGSWKQ